MAVANKKGIHVVINAVVIKGNVSEIAKTAGIDVTTKCVDSRNVP
ncbi:hydroxyethylthiazole kinase [Candidatus Endomicrobiellum trichonymphae]|nr:hydroxyethylthiazole kinase [Candidatus Endomicrobium trichonymphae]